MLLRAAVTLADLVALLRQATPVRIPLKEDGRDWVELDPPTDVQLVAGRGARVVTTGRAQLDVVDVRVPVRIKELRLALIPTLRPPAQLAFEITVERLDVAYVPGLIEGALLPRINAALAPLSARLVWNFGKTLHASLRIPPRLQPLDRFELAVAGSELDVDDERIVLEVQLSTELVRKEPAGGEP